jgi:hypothetical protein
VPTLGREPGVPEYLRGNVRLREQQMATKRWHDLTPRQRQFIMAAATIDGVLKVAALVDLGRRPVEEIRGTRKSWAAAIILINSAGAVPLAYFLKGRRRHH